MASHEFALIDKQQHGDEDEGQHSAVDHLRQNRDLHQRQVGPEDDSCASDDEASVEPVEERRFTELLVQSGLKAKALANSVRGRDRQDGRSKE